MLASAGVLAALLWLVATAPGMLARARWPCRAPWLGLLLWQALGLAGGLLAVEVGATAGLQPLGDTQVAAARALLGGRGLPLPWWALLALVVAGAVLARLTWVLVTSTGRTLAARRRHRVLLDLLAAPSGALHGARVLDHEVPVAYCLPGLRPRVVLSRGVLALLNDAEVAAVLAHERAHLSMRHDLVVLPFVALGATFPRLGPVQVAQEQVNLLVEMLADDWAARRHNRADLARALCKVGSAVTPAGGLGVGGEGVALRARRLVTPPPPLPAPAVAAVLAVSLLLAALPVLGLLLPLLPPLQ